MAQDTSTWLTKQQAADALGVSTKTVEQLARPREDKVSKSVLPALIEQAERRRPGKPAIAVYNPGDVERVRKERNPEGAAFVMVPPSPREAATMESHRTSQNFSNLSEVLLEVLQRLVPPGPFLTLDEAVKYSKVSKADLLRRLKEDKGKKLGFKTGSRWLIRRAEVDKL